MDCEWRILKALREAVETKAGGLGVRELKGKTADKCVRFQLPKLLTKGFVAYKNPQAKRGQKKIVVITEKGRECEKLLREIESWENDLKKEYNIRSFDEIPKLSLNEKLALYEKVVMESFNLCLDCNEKVAVQFMKLTLTVFRKALDKKKYDLKAMKRFYEVIHKTLSEKAPLG